MLGTLKLHPLASKHGLYLVGNEDKGIGNALEKAREFQKDSTGRFLRVGDHAAGRHVGEHRTTTATLRFPCKTLSAGQPFVSEMLK